MNNLNRVKSIFISDGTALPANNAQISAVTSGKVGIYGTDMLALDPTGVDTITTQPAIYIVEGKTDSLGNSYVKRSTKIDGASVISYQADVYSPAKRETWALGYSRSAAAGTIEVNPDTTYNYTIRFKNDKFIYSERPEVLNVSFTSSTTATQLSIATQIASSINNSSFKKNVVAIVVGDGSSILGLTSASNYGVEITSKDVEQFINTTYTLNQVYFSVHVNDTTGFGTTTTCTQIQAFAYGTGTYNQVYALENKCFGTEGVMNRRQWPIPVLDYSSNSTLALSSNLSATVSGTAGDDKVTFSGTVYSPGMTVIVRPGEKVTLGGVNYEIKYFINATVAILTSTIVAGGLSGSTAQVRYKYSSINIEFNDAINTPTGVVAMANKAVSIPVPTITAGGAYNSHSQAAIDLKALLDYWMLSTPRAFSGITI
jgi:hypothetical protein